MESADSSLTEEKIEQEVRDLGEYVKDIENLFDDVNKGVRWNNVLAWVVIPIVGVGTVLFIWSFLSLLDTHGFTSELLLAGGGGMLGIGAILMSVESIHLGLQAMRMSIGFAQMSDIPRRERLIEEKLRKLRRRSK